LRCSDEIHLATGAARRNVFEPFSTGRRRPPCQPGESRPAVFEGKRIAGKRMSRAGSWGKRIWGKGMCAREIHAVTGEFVRVRLPSPRNHVAPNSPARHSLAPFPRVHSHSLARNSLALFLPCRLAYLVSVTNWMLA
jgi:hypothetical protein